MEISFVLVGTQKRYFLTGKIRKPLNIGKYRTAIIYCLRIIMGNLFRLFRHYP